MNKSVKYDELYIPVYLHVISCHYFFCGIQELVLLIFWLCYCMMIVCCAVVV